MALFDPSSFDSAIFDANNTAGEASLVASVSASLDASVISSSAYANLNVSASLVLSAIITRKFPIFSADIFDDDVFDTALTAHATLSASASLTASASLVQAALANLSVLASIVAIPNNESALLESTATLVPTANVQYRASASLSAQASILAGAGKILLGLVSLNSSASLEATAGLIRFFPKPLSGMLLENPALETQGRGLVSALAAYTIKRTLDQGGAFSVRFPVSEPLSASLTRGWKVSLTEEGNDPFSYPGWLLRRGTVMRHRYLIDNSGQAVIALDGATPLAVLADKLNHANLEGDNVNLSGLASLVDPEDTFYVPSRTDSATATVTFNEATRLEELLRAGELFRCSLRERFADADKFEFIDQMDLPDSGYRFIKPESAPISDNISLARLGIGIIAGSPQVDFDGTEVVNRITPIGVDYDSAPLTLQYATASSFYTIRTGTNPDSTPYWYLQDDQSVARYGLRETKLVRSDVKNPNDPALDGGVARAQAANVLYAFAVNTLLKRRSETVALSVVIANGDQVWALPGDYARVKYVGKAQLSDGNFTWLNINSPMLVYSRTDNATPQGLRQVTFDLISYQMQIPLPGNPVAILPPVNPPYSPPQDPYVSSSDPEPPSVPSDPRADDNKYNNLPMPELPPGWGPSPPGAYQNCCEEGPTITDGPPLPSIGYVRPPLEGIADFFSNGSSIAFAGWKEAVGTIHGGFDPGNEYPDIITTPATLPWLNSQIVPINADRTLVLILEGVTSPVNAGLTWTLLGSVAIVGNYTANVEIWSALLPANYDINSDDTALTMYDDGQRYWWALGTQIGGSFPFEYHAAAIFHHWGEFGALGGPNLDSNRYHIAWGPDGLHWSPFNEMFGNSTGNSGEIPISETGPVIVAPPYDPPEITFAIRWPSDANVEAGDLILVVATMRVFAMGPDATENLYQFPTTFELSYPGLSFNLVSSERFETTDPINNGITHHGIAVFAATAPAGFDFTNTDKLGVLTADQQLYTAAFDSIVLKNASVVNASSNTGTGLTVSGSVAPADYEVVLSINPPAAYPTSLSPNWKFIDTGSFYQGVIAAWASVYEDPVIELEDPGVDVAWAVVTLAIAGPVPVTPLGDDFEEAIEIDLPYHEIITASEILNYNRQIFDNGDRYSKWYKVTPPAGTYELSVSQPGAATPPFVYAATGTILPQLTYLAIEQEFVLLEADGVTTYYISVGINDDVDAEITFGDWVPQPGDQFEDAIDANALPFTQTIPPEDMARYTVQDDESTFYVYGYTVWFAFTPPAGDYIIDTLDSHEDFDSQIAVWTGPDLASLVLVESNDDFGAGIQSSVEFTADGSTTYYVQVGTYFVNDVGDLVVKIQEA